MTENDGPPSPESDSGGQLDPTGFTGENATDGLQFEPPPPYPAARNAAGSDRDEPARHSDGAIGAGGSPALARGPRATTGTLAPRRSARHGPRGGAKRRSPGRRRRSWVIAAAALIAGAVSVLGYVLSSGGHAGGASSPQAAVARLLGAGETNDIARANSVLCAGDRALGELTHLQSSGRITSFTIGSQITDNGITIVTATVTTSQAGSSGVEKFPLIQQTGAWWVCFSTALSRVPPSLLAPPSALAAGASSGAESSAPPPSPVLSPIVGACQAATSGLAASLTYVDAAEIGGADTAQQCVYHSDVSETITRSLAGKLYQPLSTSVTAAVISYRSTDGSRTLTISTAREPDGSYYVTAVQIG